MASAASAYAERADAREPWHDRLASALVAPWPRPAGWSAPGGRGRIVAAAEAFDAGLRHTSDDDLRARARALRPVLARTSLAEQAPGPCAEALALWREAAARVLGTRPFASQLEAAAGLLRGRLVEMATGEGKTLAAALAAGVAALRGTPVHVITVNDYLAERDAHELAPLYRFFGCSVAHVVQGMPAAQRRAAYACDISYAANKELAFDYLRDRVAIARDGGGAGRLGLGLARLARLGSLDGTGPRGGAASAAPGSEAPGLLLRGLHVAIVDEADSVLIDEARTPLVLSADRDDADDAAQALPERLLELARGLQAGLHYTLDPAQRRIELSAAGSERLAAACAEATGLLASPRAREDRVQLALSALWLHERDRHYVVHEGRVQIVDESTGRLMPDRSWQSGLHQLIEAKEGLPPSPLRHTVARLTYQRLFRRYLHLCGLTGTAHEVRRELWHVYRLRVHRVALHQPSRRVMLPPHLLPDADAKWRRVVERVRAVAVAQRRPVLIGTRSVAASEALSRALQAQGIDHDLLNGKLEAQEAAVVARAGEAGRVTVATNMAGRGTDIRLAAGVALQGGLHVILTEFHSSARVDRQLIGRGARQGDPGSAEMITACDDEVVALNAGWLAGWLQARLRRGQPVPTVGVAVLRLWAQARAMARDARQRRQVLRQDLALDRWLAFSGGRE